ncbi:RNA-binding ATPase activator esf2 [Coelomomyces lativittatus]|nr:RNA-binding ATPase activator esf2 [Coelomomyces lativittatus]KAJ1510523.1 RNA-binding ATPase activator esf2 [Coelomomyces lativittatus]KAJ1514144.1 RNA-binding ATPase activator esf2 [Coelomomyces lativittatus]
MENTTEVSQPSPLPPATPTPPASTSTGLVYISHVPPAMTPTQLKILLNQHAKVKRVFLKKENAKSTQRRKKFKGNGRVRYVEGWVEFEKKSEAKRIALLLNGKLIGGKNLSKFHDDIWTIKYLPGFHWKILTEQIAYEKKQRELRLRNEIVQAKKESKMYLKQVATSKMIQSIQKKADKRKEESNPCMDETNSDHQVMEALQSQFKQYKVEKKDYDENSRSVPETEMVDGSTLFSKLFGGSKKVI